MSSATPADRRCSRSASRSTTWSRQLAPPDSGTPPQAVVALRGSGGHKQLVAYLDMPAPAAALSDEEIRAKLADLLPEYMIPRHYCRVDGFLRQAHGKVDRQALPELGVVRPAASYIPPQGPAQQVIADIWKEILGTERVGMHDDFFDLGGDSLLATRVVGALRRSFDGVARPVSVTCTGSRDRWSSTATADRVGRWLWR
jgi:hypothetical protein